MEHMKLVMALLVGIVLGMMMHHFFCMHQGNDVVVQRSSDVGGHRPSNNHGHGNQGRF